MRRRYALLLLAVLAGGSARADALLWFQNDRLTGAGTQLLEELGRADARGLVAADYDAPGIRSRLAQAGTLDRAAVARLDADLSVAATRFVADLHQGRVKPSELGYDLELKRAPFDARAVVEQLAHAASVATVLDSIEPSLGHFALLKQALARYRALNVAHPELTRLPDLPRAGVRPGEEYSGAPALRRLLVALGDMEQAAAPPSAGSILDPELVDGVKRFQARHGLDTDGVIGRATFHALTTPFVVRVQQIELSLERIRWLPLPLSSPPIIVNIPQFQLFAFRTVEDAARDILQMKVIVGETFVAKRTPVFSAEMRSVVLQPYWDVPRSILLKELLPEIRRRPAWLEAHGYEIVRGAGDDARIEPPTAANIELLARGVLRLRQRPGPENALGRVKFVLPNKYDVYLHDTPTHALFNRSRRAFSHGCIRVSDPMALLDHVMRADPAWSTERRDEALARNTPTRIALSRGIPVLILYGTALATEAGEVLFFDDIYAQDAPLLGKLAARSARLRGNT